MARKWEAIITYEDRSKVHTSRWRLTGVATKEGAQNTDDGVLWLVLSKSGDTVTATLYKDDGLASGNSVATGTADVSSIDATGENAAECTLAEANSSGMSGSFYIHDWQDTPDNAIPLQVALCTDEDLDGLDDAVEALDGYDETNGCAEFIRLAGEDIIGHVTALFMEKLGGYGTNEAWFILDASRIRPDLRRIANPGQLRLACAYRALAVAFGRSHKRGEPTMYSAKRDYYTDQYLTAMNSLQLAFKPGDSDNAASSGSTSVIHMKRA